MQVQEPEKQAREQARLLSLDKYDLLDTPREEAFDRITRLVRRVLDVPMSTVTLIDGHRQWFKSKQGVAVDETPRSDAICDVAIREDAPLIIPDTLADDRSKDNPYVRGEPHIRFYAGAPLRTPEGQTIGTLCALDTKPRAFEREQVELLTDLAALVLSELELRLLATTDGLTGALSRRAFREEASRAFSLAARHRHELSCVAFDLDHFKRINDSYGHAVGDRVLAGTVGACREVLRQSDLIGRMGGEEFAVLLPHTGRTAAMNVAEKLRAAVASQTVEGDSGPISVTASFGVATFDWSVGDIEALLEGADSALYDAKRDGRNRCARWLRIENPDMKAIRRVLKAGQITFNAGRSTIDCTVKGISTQGARLDVSSTAGIPDTFKLRILADDLSQRCRVVAKQDRHIEVAFD